MIKSMTGYGRAEEFLSGYHIIVEIKAVNHRYFEFLTRLPKAYGYLEEKLKGLVRSRVFRGKIELFVAVTAVETTNNIVEINYPLAQAYLNSLTALGEALGLEDDIALSDMLRFGDLFSVYSGSGNQEQVWTLVEQVALVALEQLLDMRKTEGLKLREDIIAHLQILSQGVSHIAARAPALVDEWRAKLLAKLYDILETRKLDETRIVTEAALFAEKIAVDEETVRLQSHITQFYEFLQSADPVGRKLDFLVQEMNREVNTIGSKIQDLAVSRIVVELKAELEKIREQIQNLE